MIFNGDNGNAFFEAGGALVVWRNVLQIHRDRQVKGVWWPIWAFYTVWGGWNLWYYPSLGQWHSFAAGIALFAGNLVWVSYAYGLWLRARREAVMHNVLYDDRHISEYRYRAVCIDADGNQIEVQK